VVFPLSALLLVALARVTLDKWHHVNLLKLAIPLLLAMAVIRLTVHALKRAFPGPAGWPPSSASSPFLRGQWWPAHHRVLPAVIDGLEQISFPVGKAKRQSVDAAAGRADGDADRARRPVGCRVIEAG
jgi:hypothetical protein